MAAPDVGKIIYTPGRLCVDPTDLTTAWPHGGTGLGLVDDIVVRPTRRYEKITEEAFGSEVIDVLDLGEAWAMAVKLRSFDAAALAKVFPSTFTGSTSGETGVSYPGSSFRAGTLKNANFFKLLFTPDDADRGLWVYFPNAIAMLDEAAELNLEIRTEGVLGAVFLAVRDASSPVRVVVIGRKGDITL